MHFFCHAFFMAVSESWPDTCSVFVQFSVPVNLDTDDCKFSERSVFVGLGIGRTVNRQ
jgi:hypothetical protein